MKYFFSALLLSSSIITIESYAASDVEMEEAASKYARSHSVAGADECADGDISHVHLREALAGADQKDSTNSPISASNDGIMAPDSQSQRNSEARRRTHSEANPSDEGALNDEGAPSKKRQRTESSVETFTSVVPNDVWAKHILPLLSVEDLKAYRQTGRVIRDQVDEYAKNSVMQLLSYWEKRQSTHGVPDIDLSEVDQKRIFAIATQFATYGEDKGQIFSLIQQLFDSKGFIVAPKGEAGNNLIKHLRDADGSRSIPRLLSHLACDDVTGDMHQVFKEKIGSDRLQRVALQYALSRFKVYGVLPKDSVALLAQQLLRDVPQDYMDYDSALQNLNPIQPRYIVVTDEQLKDSKRKENLKNWFNEDSPHTLVVDFDGEELHLKNFRNDFPPQLTRLAFTNIAKNLREIYGTVRDYESIGLTGLTSIDLSNLTMLESIYDCIFPDHPSLTACDLSGNTSLEEIDCPLLKGNENLSNIDLSGLTALRRIDGFLSSCNGLINVDASALRSLQATSELGFLFDCKELISFDTSSFKEVEVIGEGFLDGCHSLASINMSGLSNVRVIEESFLAECHKLKDCDTSYLSRVERIGYNFLFGTGITSFRTAGLEALQEIGESFLESCKGLQFFDASGLVSIRKIGPNFLKGSIPDLPTIFFRGVTPQFIEALREHNPDVVERIEHELAFQEFDEFYEED